MNSKGLAVLIAAIIVFSSLFFFFHITMPSGPIKIKAKIPPPLNEPFFQNQVVSPTILNVDGANAYNFTFTGNATTRINGYLTNASDGAAISGLTAWISLYPAAAEYPLTLVGYYVFYALRAGSGMFIVKVPGYNDKVVNLDLTGKTVWLNLSLQPALKYQVSGTTVYSNGTIAPDVGIKFTGYFETYTTTSSSTGTFSENMFNDSYLITVSATDVNPQPSPYIINVTGSAIPDLVLTLYPGSVQFNASGWITNAEGAFLSGATVSSPNSYSITLTNSTGYYEIPVPEGFDTIVATMQNYMPNETTIFFLANITDINLTLYNVNPYNGSTSPIGPGNYNSSQYLNNSSSTVNYSNKANYTLQGTINNTLNGLPVAYTLVNFIINVNGSYFDEQAVTALNGSYTVGFSYPGTYHILVETGFYQSKMINVTIIAPVTTKNFSLVPLLNSTYILKGTVVNYYTGVPIQSASVYARLYGDALYSILNVTGSNGTSSFLLPESNYTLYAQAAGYRSNETPLFHLGSNLTMIIELKPLSWNSQLWNGSGVTMPGENSSQVQQNLSGSGNYSSSSLYDVKIQFINSSSGTYASFTQFLIIYQIQKIPYYFILTSNQSGIVDLGPLEAGNYSFFVQSVPFEPKAFLLDVSQNNTYVEYLTPRFFIGVSVTLGDSAISYGQNRSVPTQTFSVTNSALPIPITALQGLSGTTFSFSGWNGTFNFTYVNPSFITWSNNTTVKGTLVLLAANVTPIGAMINYNTSTGWFYRSTFNPNSVKMAAGTGSLLVFLQLGFNGLVVNLSLGSHLYVLNFTLSKTAPVKQVYLNITTKDELMNYSTIGRSGQTGYFNYSNTTPLATQSEIFGANISYALTSSTELYLNNVLTGFTYAEEGSGSTTYSVISLTSLDFSSPSSLNLELITQLAGSPPLQMQVYYYEITFT